MHFQTPGDTMTPKQPRLIKSPMIGQKIYLYHTYYLITSGKIYLKKITPNGLPSRDEKDIVYILQGMFEEV